MDAVDTLGACISECADGSVGAEDESTEALVRSGYSTTYGARPLRRAVQRMCEDAVAEAILSGFVNAGESLELDGEADGESVVLKNQKGKRKVHVPTAAQGIEEDEAGGFAVAPDSDGTIRVTRPAAIP